jgi:two-component system, sensor histidine kinase PdtaS
MENLLLLPNKPASILARYLATTAIVGIFFLIRVTFHHEAGVYGFYLLLPGVFLAAALFDRGSGFYASALSAGLVLLILHMDDRLDPIEQHLIPTILYLIVAGGLAAVSEALRRALERAVIAEREKDLLFKELGHRTRNNLHVISSLIALQGKAHPHPQVKEALEAAEARVRIIADAQTALQPGERGGQVNLRDYLADLVEKLGHSLRGLRPIAVHVEAEDIHVDGEIAVPIGLIVNELITNAFKYAFRDEAGGRIEVGLKRVGNALELTVRDNGGGCDGIEEGLGSRLLRLLVQQLKGSMTRAAADPGCIVKVTIPHRPR